MPCLFEPTCVKKHLVINIMIMIMKIKAIAVEYPTYLPVWNTLFTLDHENYDSYEELGLGSRAQNVSVVQGKMFLVDQSLQIWVRHGSVP